MRQLAFSVLILVMATGCQKNESADNSEPAAAPVFAPDFWKEFGENTLQADTKYKGKKVRVRGYASAVQADNSGKYYAGFTAFSYPGAVSQEQLRRMTDQEKKWFREGVPPSVLCYIGSGQKASFADVKADQLLQVIGRCVGTRKDPDAYQGYVVVLEDCTWEPAAK